MKRLLILLALLMLVLPATAQTEAPEPTAAATDAVAAPAPTAEAPAIVIDPDGTVTIPVDETPEPARDEITLTAVQLILIVVSALFAGTISAGGIAAFVMRDPVRIDMAEKLGNSVPKETADRIVSIVEIFTPILTLTKEVFDRVPYAEKPISAQISDAFDAERQKQREGLNAQAVNREYATSAGWPLNLVPPPTGPANPSQG